MRPQLLPSSCLWLISFLRYTYMENQADRKQSYKAERPLPRFFGRNIRGDPKQSYKAESRWGAETKTLDLLKQSYKAESVIVDETKEIVDGSNPIKLKNKDP